MTPPTSRVTSPALAAGVLVACAAQVLAGTAVAAMGLGLWSRGHTLGGGSLTWLVAGLAVGYGGSVWVGARVTAINARLQSRRDGALAGLLTWAALLLVGVTVGAGVAVVGGFAPVVITIPAELAPAELLVDALWAFVLTQLVALPLAFLGGLSGARAELRREALLADDDRAMNEMDAYDGGFYAAGPAHHDGPS